METRNERTIARIEQTNTSMFTERTNNKAYQRQSLRVWLFDNSVNTENNCYYPYILTEKHFKAAKNNNQHQH